MCTKGTSIVISKSLNNFHVTISLNLPALRYPYGTNCTGIIFEKIFSNFFKKFDINYTLKNFPRTVGITYN